MGAQGKETIRREYDQVGGAGSQHRVGVKRQQRI